MPGSVSLAERDKVLTLVQDRNRGSLEKGSLYMCMVVFCRRAPASDRSSRRRLAMKTSCYLLLNAILSVL